MISRQINGRNLLKRGEKRKRGWRTSRSSANDLTRKTNVIHGRKVRSGVRGFSRFIAAIRLSEFQLKRPKCPARNTGGNNFQRNTGRAPANEQRWKASHEYDWHRAISWRSTRATRSGKKRIGRKKEPEPGLDRCGRIEENVERRQLYGNWKEIDGYADEKRKREEEKKEKKREEGALESRVQFLMKAWKEP